jgi:hypothetical protein
MLSGYAACACRRPLPSVVLGGYAACARRGRGRCCGDTSVQRRKSDVHERVSIQIGFCDDGVTTPTIKQERS